MRVINRDSLHLSAAMAAALLASAPAAAAEQAAGENSADDIVVTAQHREQSVQDVPVAISVLGGGTLKSAGAVSSREIQNFAPNVDITRIQSNSNPRIYIRGVGSSDSFAGGNPAVATYVDDMVIGSISGNTFGMFDIERVEVLRGPQGSLYGRNATAGALNYLSVQPGYKADGYLTVGLGNYNAKSVEGATNLPLVDDKLSLRVSGIYKDRDGTVRNTFDNAKNLGDDRFYGGRAILRYTPTTDLDIRLTVFGGKADPHAVPWKAVGTQTPGAVTTPCTFAQINTGTCVDSLGKTFPDPFDPNVASLNYPSREETGTLGGHLKVEYNFPSFTLTSITAAARYTRKVGQDLDGSTGTVQHYFFDWDTRTVSQELRLTSSGKSRLQWLLGAFYYEFKTDADSYSTQLGFPAPTFNSYFQKTTSKALFAHADYELVDRLTVSAGLRYTNEKARARESAFYLTTPVTTVYDQFAQQLDNSKLSGDAAIKLDLTDDINAYLSYARGFRAGTINSAPVFNTAQINAIKPETLDSYEFGIKSRLFDRRLQLNFATFLYKYKDMQVSNFLNVNGRAVTITANAATAKVFGLEADGLLSVTNNFKLRGAVGYLPTAKFEKYSITNVATFDGKRLPNAPEWTANLGADLTVPISSALNVQATVNAAYFTDIYFSAANDPKVARPGYWNVSARAGVETADKRWSISAWVKNLTDSRHTVYVTDFSSIYGFLVRSYADPVTFGVELTHRL